MIRVVIDTSVLVSLSFLLAAQTLSFLTSIVAKRIRPCVTETLLKEYALVFNYERLLHLDRSRIALFARSPDSRRSEGEALWAAQNLWP
jgi:predicted nucleic acid-binding protein